jgi:hypothetical protein
MGTDLAEPEFPQARILPPRPCTLDEQILDAIDGIEDFLLSEYQQRGAPGPELMWVHGIRDALLAVLAWLPVLRRRR